MQPTLLRPSRARWLGALAAIAASTRGVRGATLRRIAVGVTTPAAGEWPTFACEELGLFRQAGLDADVVYVSQATAAAQQLAAGSLDVAKLSTTQLVEAVVNGAPVAFFLSTISTPPYSMVAQSSHTPAERRNATRRCARGASPQRSSSRPSTCARSTTGTHCSGRCKA